MKKIITLTMIKNESDIVETFVRYTMNFASKMIFIDNGCVDGSKQIMKELIKDGFDLEIFTEAHIFHEQYIIENKYIKKIASKYEFDFLIPLDVDEFLVCDSDLIIRIDRLPQDKVTMLNWKTYCMLSDHSEDFFMDRIIHIRINEDKVFTKVIIPHNILIEGQVLVTMGHHDIESSQKIDRYCPKDIYISHFPVRSKEQIRLKIYQGVIAQLMSNYHKVIAFHWKKLQEEIKQNRFDVIDYSMEYALLPEQDLTKISYIEEKFNYAWCPVSIKPKYEKLQKKNTLDMIYEMMQVMAIKSIIKENDRGKNVLIYGTGKTVEKLFEIVDCKQYNILAYVDSDVMKEYSQFQNKLVIAPDKIKYINYDKIIVASNYFSEIYDLLKEIGVEEIKIVSRFDVMEEQLKKSI